MMLPDPVLGSSGPAGRDSAIRAKLKATSKQAAMGKKISPNRRITPTKILPFGLPSDTSTGNSEREPRMRLEDHRTASIDRSLRKLEKMKATKARKGS